MDQVYEWWILLSYVFKFLLNSALLFPLLDSIYSTVIRKLQTHISLLKRIFQLARRGPLYISTEGEKRRVLTNRHERKLSRLNWSLMLAESAYKHSCIQTSEIGVSAEDHF